MSNSFISPSPMERHVSKGSVAETEKGGSQSEIPFRVGPYSIHESYTITEELLISKTLGEIQFQVCLGKLNRNEYWEKLVDLIECRHIEYQKQLRIQTREARKFGSHK